MYKKGFDYFGITDILKSWMSDCSQASLKLETLLGVPHALCFQHFRQHLWDAVSTFDVPSKGSLLEIRYEGDEVEGIRNRR